MEYAKRILKHYIKVLFEKTGTEFHPKDNGNEIEGIIDDIAAYVGSINVVLRQSLAEYVDRKMKGVQQKANDNIGLIERLSRDFHSHEDDIQAYVDKEVAALEQRIIDAARVPDRQAGVRSNDQYTIGGLVDKVGELMNENRQLRAQVLELEQRLALEQHHAVFDGVMKAPQTHLDGGGL